MRVFVMRYLDDAVTDAGGIALRYGSFYGASNDGMVERIRKRRFPIVGDDPAPLRDWLPVLAEALGAKPPRHFPKWLARLVAGEAMVMLATDARGASNAKARRQLGWEPRYPSWRDGFAAVYGGSMSSARSPGLIERWPSERSKRTA